MTLNINVEPEQIWSLLMRNDNVCSSWQRVVEVPEVKFSAGAWSEHRHGSWKTFHVIKTEVHIFRYET